MGFARVEHTIDGLRMYCLQSLSRRRFLDAEDDNDHLRGYREGFQIAPRDIRGVETRGRRP
jgi:hypothetical protein